MQEEKGGHALVPKGTSESALGIWGSMAIGNNGSLQKLRTDVTVSTAVQRMRVLMLAGTKASLGNKDKWGA